jgi:hypothetical protein
MQVYHGHGTQAASPIRSPGIRPQAYTYHHQPFAYFAEYAAGTPGKAEHLKDERDMMRQDATGGDVLPANRTDDEHPGYANLVYGDDHVALVIRAIQNSFIWDHYRYNKQLSGGKVITCQVAVFLLRVRRVFDVWPEHNQRLRAWFSPEIAAKLVAEKGLSDILLGLTPTVLALGKEVV